MGCPGWVESSVGERRLLQAAMHRRMGWGTAPVVRSLIRRQGEDRRGEGNLLRLRPKFHGRAEYVV
jgi:hypothetical protein